MVAGAGIASLFSLEGRRALVTGSSRGIGRAIGQGLAAAGARLVFHGSAMTDALREAAAQAGSQALSATGDLADGAAVQRLIHDVGRLIGGVDILVLNASVEIRQAYDRITPEALQQQVAVNLAATQALVAGLVPGMAARGWGRVLAIGSVQEVKEHPDMLVYAGLKAAQTSMMRNLARQFAKRGVTCNVLAPGAIETDRNAGVLADPAYRERVRSRIPTGDVGRPEDCVGAALFLCSDAARYVTGERLLVDGGMHL